jgi:hypothetical protein
VPSWFTDLRDGEPTGIPGGRSLLAVPDPAPHPTLLATHLATTFPTATTGHALSSTGVDSSTIGDRTIATKAGNCES